jgi:hypothetical protein
MSNGVGLVLAILLVVIEWISRSHQAKAHVSLARTDVNACE